MILAICMLIVAGIIYYSCHQIPPDPLFPKEVCIEEKDFWENETDETIQKATMHPLHPVAEASETLVLPKYSRNQSIKDPKKAIKKRRKKRRIAKKSRQQNRIC